jgi:uncharacterized protein
MSVFLLDVNVLIGLYWHGQADHELVADWFHRRGARGWATCPMTQAAFVRIVSNPRFSTHATSPREAQQLLGSNMRDSKHEFWKDELTLDEALIHFAGRVVGHRQITDAYLLGLALHRKGKLATLDRGILDLLPKDSPYRDSVELIGK